VRISSLAKIHAAADVSTTPGATALSAMPAPAHSGVVADLRIEMGDSVVAKLAEQAVAAGATDVSHINDCTVVLIDAAKAASAVRAWIEANFQ
jgi:hypothetical protein